MKKLIMPILLMLFPFVLLGQNKFREVEQKNQISLYKQIHDSKNEVTDNQSQYDVKYYKINLNFKVSTVNSRPNLQINGSVQISAKVISNINSFELNLTNGMLVDSVLLKKSPLYFTQFSNQIIINLDREYSIDEMVELVIYYHGSPTASGFGSVGVTLRKEDNSNVLIWTLSEPFGARDWWPCKDFPNDKADSVDIIATVPKNYIVASNGLLRNTTSQDSTKTYYWHEGYPISTYLVSVTAYPYRTFSNYYKYSPTDSMEIQYYVFPDHYNAVQTDYARTPNMIKIFSDLFGQYPFIKEKYGHAEFTWGGGMEHQTCTSLGGWSEYLIVHELAHSWWGDMITCKDFHHIWMNEGFATYSEALYAEKAYGMSAYRREMEYTKYFGSGTIFVPEIIDVSRIFSMGLTYNKGNWVLHMLRRVVGDSNFFKILRTFYSDSRYKYNVVTTEDFQALCESIYGKDLGWFFQEWIYQEYFPTYNVKWSKTQQTNDRTEIKLNLSQTQNNYVFKMPVDITLYTSKGDTTIIIMDSLKSQDFSFTINGKLDSLKIDKDEWILKKINSTVSVRDENNLVEPSQYILNQNYPNPFNPGTVISFQLPVSSFVSLKIYDMLGREIETLLEKNMNTGKHSVTFSGDKLSSGIYFYKLRANDFQDVKKLMLLR